MDFLKSCSTNVRVVEDVTSIPCQAYTGDGAASMVDRRKQLSETLTQLREDNVLCGSFADKLYVFGSRAEDANAIVTDSGHSTTEVSGEDRIPALLDAIEGLLAYKLTADGLTHIGPWTWLFHTKDQDDVYTEASTAIKLHSKIGSDGALFISSTFQASELSPAETATSSSVILAPSGREATVCIGRSNEASVVVGNAKWKADVGDMLLAEGVALADEEQWAEVELVDEAHGTRFLWPIRLCFQSSTTDTPDLSTSRDDWKKWFTASPANGKVFRDPLAAAEEWFTGAARREDSGLTDESLLPEPSGPPTLPDATADLVTSPPFNQRAADQQAAMVGIYPTPPDGMLPGTQGTQVPTSDSNPMPSIHESSELLPGEEMEGLRQSISSSHAPEGGFHRSDDDLFGDMGEIDFGGNEVGDADFDYFDEPDEEPGTAPDDDGIADLDMPDVDRTHDNAEVEKVSSEQMTGHEHLTHTEDVQHVSEESVKPTTGLDITNAHSEVEVANAEDSATVSETPPHQPERPLSPFGIRERLLPPPIPASTVRAESEKKINARRSSAFGPVTFNEGLGLAAKYGEGSMMGARTFAQQQNSDSTISLPSTRKQTAATPLLQAGVENEGGSDHESETSTGTSDDSDTSTTDSEPPPKMPWESRKRKRATSAGGGAADERAWAHANLHAPDDASIKVSVERVSELQCLLLHPHAEPADTHFKRRVSDLSVHDPDNQSHGDHSNDDDHLPHVDEFFSELEDLDLVYVAQIVAEQSVSIMPQLLEAAKLATTSPLDSTACTAIRPLFERALEAVLPNVDVCDLTKLALPRDNARPMPSQSGKGPHPVQRPLQRSDSMQQGADYSPIPPPYIRVQRHGDTVEMLPPALQFWSTLGLSPASGTKDVRVVSLVPSNTDLAHSVQDFLRELQLVYEANKLGSWKALPASTAETPEEVIVHSDSIFLARSRTPGPILPVSDVMQAYIVACEWLGRALASIGHEDADRTIIVYIFSPFHDARTQQLICACFWLLYKAYRDNTPKAHRNTPRSDIILRIIPCGLVASSDGLVILDHEQYTQLAMEIYDRCPPSAKASTSRDVPPALMTYFAAPAVELALPVPRRIPFQLTADPPGDLLHENSVLHLAYALSSDRDWMCFSWIDGSGRYAHQMSACLRGKSIADIVAEAWERTGEWLRARDVTWRVYVVGCGGEVDSDGAASVRECWRDVVSSKARRQMLHVTLLDVDLQPNMQLTPPPPPSAMHQATGEKSGQGFLTPVTTPSGASMTVSPDASAAAPPTPAPSDPAAEADGEAHLVDVADESWGLMLAPAFTNTTTANTTSAAETPGGDTQGPLAAGMLFRRGLASVDTPLESLVLSLHWDIRIRPNGAVDEGPARQAEYTLREVLRLYRNLAVLGRARGLCGGGREEGKGEEGVVPVHVAGVVRMMGALVEMLG